MFWDKTITLYNKSENEDGLITWYRHKLEECFWKHKKSGSDAGNVRTETDEGIIRIPAQANYVSAYDWQNLSNAEKGEYMTLKKDDLIFLGDVSEEIDEYTAGKRSSDLIAKYKLLGSVSVVSVVINDFAPGAHYFVRGE